MKQKELYAIACFYYEPQDLNINNNINFNNR